MTVSTVPRLCDTAPLPGVVRSKPEDFCVEELPLYPPSGEGDHVFFEVEKRGIATPDLLRLVARALEVPHGSIGYAGRKDARAVTRQTLSVEHVSPEKVLALELELEGVRVLGAVRHGNKLRVGHLSGNRFRIVVRASDPARVEEARAMLGRLESDGLPNAFGPQRFGNRGDTWRVGAALVSGDAQEAVRLIAGSPGPSDEGPVLRARELFEAGEYGAAARTWPRGYADCGRLSQAMARHRGRASRALRALTRRELGFYVGAWQARIFNLVLAERMPYISRVEEGEVAFDHGTLRTFVVEDLREARARAEAFEISPTGPLVGAGTTRRAPGAAVGELERRVFAEHGADSIDPRRMFGNEGGRRPLRIRPTEPWIGPVLDDPTALEVRFALPRGSYATAVLSELFEP